MDTASIAVILSAITLVILVGEKLFGGGNRLAGLFHKLDKDTSTAMSALRTELTRKVDEYEDNFRVGQDAFRSNIHALQIAMLELRAKMAEEYMRVDGYDKGISEIKADMRDGFDRIDKRLERIERPSTSA